MAGKAGLKAGLIGAAVLVALTLLELIPIPYLACACFVIRLLVYAGIGVLAGFFLTPPRTAGTGAGAGAIAGAIGGLISGIVSMIAAVVQGAVGVASGALDPEMLRLFTEFGADIDPETLALLTGAGAGMGAAISGVSCLCSLAVGAALGAIGGVIFGAAKRD